jgi:hypothetical protein
VRTGFKSGRALSAHAPEEEFRPHTRDLYVPAGDIGMWQGAMRDPDDPVRAATADAIEARDLISIELLYTDQIGGQRTITRFSLVPTADTWLVSVTRHWYLDWDGPRPESQVLAGVETIQRERDAADRRAAEREGARIDDPDAPADDGGDGAAAGWASAGEPRLDPTGEGG